jgi:endonuclease/exonuclease/phosphatase family metal-dependent hydrolase
MIRFASLVLLSLIGAQGHSELPITLRVLTYNIHHGEGTDRRFDLPRLAGVIERLAPDLVALQEVDVGTERAGGQDQLAELARLTGMHAEFGKAMDYDGGGYGVAVLSRWPFVGVSNQPLPRALDREPRTALTVKVRPGARGPLVQFSSTHLDQGRDPENRLAQVDALNQFLAHTETPSILAGDLNARRDADPMLALEAEWSNTSTPDSDPGFTSGRPRSRGDHVLVRPAGRWRVLEWNVIDETLASDHRPVLVVLELDPGGFAPADPPRLRSRGPNAPFRSGGRARGAPSPLCGSRKRVQSSRFRPHNGLTTRR